MHNHEPPSSKTGGLDATNAGGNNGQLKRRASSLTCPSAVTLMIYPAPMNHSRGPLNSLRTPRCFSGLQTLRPAHGRAMERLDWNKDAREDPVVANQFSFAQPLKNDTPPKGRGLVFQFRSTLSVSVNSFGFGQLLQFRSTSSTCDSPGSIAQLRCGS
jgi:hypothetical protein